MRTPPLLMGGALLFWGWENGFMLVGVLLAASLEGSRLTRTRREFSNADLNRISDLCWALVVGAALLLYSTVENRLLFVFKLAQWLPGCLCPLMLAQAYGNRATMPLSVFWPLLRRSPVSQTAGKSYNISYCYFALCVLAASASTRLNPYFYPGIILLVALALTSARPRRVSLAAWVILLALAVTAGQAGQSKLKSMQNTMEGVLYNWIADFLRGPPPDSRECQTRIGSAGQIPQSGKIVLRLRPEHAGFAPALLRERTWDAYRKTTWLASNDNFYAAPAGDNDSYKLLPPNPLASEVEIACYYENGSGILALPHGTFEIDNVQAYVETNRLGMARIDSGPGLLDMRATFGPGRSLDAPPCERDLMVPAEEKPVLAKVAADLKLAEMTERQKIRAIERFFANPANHFTYSLHARPLPYHLLQPTALGFFLRTSRLGHCEYFATATVLLLREAGVPARYVTGYAVPKSARHGDTCLVRARDAHAWALAYHSDTGLWDQIDTTPADRDKAEGAQPPWWEPASDALSNLYFQLSKWRWSKTSYARYSTWLLAPTILYLIGRIAFSQRRRRPASGADDAARRPPWPGLDSELYLINQQLAAAQLSRLPNEPLLSWQQRLELAFPDSDGLRRIFHLHRSLRFDPCGLKKEDRETLRSESQRWLAEFAARMAQEKPSAPS
jgi:protein-glutamine gamma-glutamyltransferase